MAVVWPFSGPGVSRSLLCVSQGSLLVDLLHLGLLAQSIVGLHDANDLVVGPAVVDGQFAGVGVPDAELPDLDAPGGQLRVGGKASHRSDSTNQGSRAKLFEELASSSKVHAVAPWW
jgi:hypothetical protein